MLGILADVHTLIREEIELARAELRNEVGRLRGAAIGFGMAALSLTFGTIFILIAAAIGIADVMDWPLWAGFLAVSTVMIVVGLTSLAVGRRRLGAGHDLPSETLSTLKENSEWIANRLSSAQR